MADDTRLVTCAFGRSFVIERASTLRRVREHTEHESLWIVYLDDRFHHVCSLM